MSGLKVLVVGASIAGPMTAYWLAKAGATVTVIERFPKLRTNGQNVDIRTIGVAVMRKIPGMEEAVRGKHIGIEGLSWVNDKGQSYGVLKATGNPDQQSLVSEYEIFRGDLTQILFDLTKDNPNVNYIFGEQVASMQDNGRLTVEFANGTPTSEYDLVVACDGSTSRTRAIGLACGVRDHMHPTGSWSAYYSMPEILDSKIAHGYSAVGGRFVAVGPDPAGVNRVGLMGINSTQDAVIPFRQAVKQGDSALKDFVANHYEGAGWRTEEIMQGMKESDDFYATEWAQVKVPSLYKGGFVMVGDAGYAPGPTGTGTSLAMAGAYVLAGEIGKHKDLEAGLKGYEDTMRPFITDMQKVPPFVRTIMAPQTAWGIWLRNNIFMFIIWTGILGFAQKYLAGAFASTEKYPLPEYQWAA